MSGGSGMHEVSAWDLMNHEELLADATRQHSDKLDAERKLDFVTTGCVSYICPEAQLATSLLFTTRRMACWWVRRVPILKHTRMQADLVVDNYQAGLSVEEIADQTGSPTGTVKARLARGRKALAPHVSEFADASEDGGKPFRPPMESGNYEHNSIPPLGT